MRIHTNFNIDADEYYGSRSKIIRINLIALTHFNLHGNLSFEMLFSHFAWFICIQFGKFLTDKNVFHLFLSRVYCPIYAIKQPSYIPKIRVD